MASSGSNSSGSGNTQITNSGSEGDLQMLMNERKRKRMQSNRESARRSRMRKQQHLDELMTQAEKLKKENSHILSKINVTTQHYMTIEADNSVLRAQMMELSQRLESLNDILSYINNTPGSGSGSIASGPVSVAPVFDDFVDDPMMNMNMNMNDPWMFMMNPQQQPIMASADFLHHY